MRENFENFSRCSLKAIFIFIIFFNMDNAVAQQNTRIKGTVTEENGEIIAGVTVKVKGIQIGTITDSVGKYVILIPSGSNAVLVFSHLGYKGKQVTVGSQKIIDVQMARDVTSLDEVVIIGYGQVEKKDVTGSIATIKPTENDAIQFNSVDALIRGRATGVQVTQSNGSPGGALNVKIRGINSLRGNDQPLYVVDGIIISNASLDTKDVFSAGNNASNQESQNGLTGINPQDIASIQILKDASATAIYGSRGANGVVIITTKQGNAGAQQINFSSTVGIAKVSKQIKVLDGPSYAKYQNELAALNSLPPVYSLDTLQYIYWQDDLQQTAITQDYRISFSGASKNDKSNYYIAGGHSNFRGVIKNSGLSQNDFLANFTQSISRKLTANIRISGTFRSNNSTNGTERLGSGNNSLINQMVTSAPILNILPEIGDDISDAPSNPRVWIDDYDDISKEQRILATTDLNYRFSNAFSYKLNLSADYRNKERTKWQGKSTLPGQKANGALGLSQLQRQYYLVENLIFFRKKINKNNRIDATLGVTYDNELISSSSVLNTNFFSGSLGVDGFGFGEILYPYERDKTRAELFSVLGRANYTVGDKFVFTLSGRADGSSKFAPGNKFSFFPSAAIAYKLINENFIKNISAISDLKLRLGYGESGNQAIDPYGTLSRYNKISYSDDGNVVTIGTTPSNIANPALKWETTWQFNAGIDAGFFNNRLTATLDVYYKKTKDLLQTLLLPQSAGFGTIVINRGSLQNKGIEFLLNALLIDKKEISWSVSPNISFNRNKLLNLGLPPGTFGTLQGVGYIGGNISTTNVFNDPANIFLEGYPLGMFYGYQTNGVFQNATEASGQTGIGGAPVQPGDLRIVDQNKDNAITEADKVLIGNPNPKFTFGLNTSVSYKHLTLNLFFNGVYGNDVVNGNSIRLNALNSNFNVLAEAYNNAWSTTNASNYPRVGFSNLNFIDRYVEDGSFLRLATASLRYTLPLKTSKFIKQVDFTLTGDNLFVITNYSGFDPEVNSFSFDASRIGVDWNAYPHTRAVSLGLNLKF